MAATANFEGLGIVTLSPHRIAVIVSAATDAGHPANTRMSLPRVAQSRCALRYPTQRQIPRDAAGVRRAPARALRARMTVRRRAGFLIPRSGQPVESAKPLRQQYPGGTTRFHAALSGGQAPRRDGRRRELQD